MQKVVISKSYYTLFLIERYVFMRKNDNNTAKVGSAFGLRTCRQLIN